MELLKNIFAFKIIDILMLIILIFLTKCNLTIPKPQRKAFFVTVISVILLILGDFISIVIDYTGTKYIGSMIVLNTIWYMLTMFALIAAAFTININLKEHVIYFMIPFGIAAISLIISLFNGCIFSITSEGKYMRGPFFWIYMACYFLCILIIVFFSFRKFVILSMANKHLLCLIHVLICLGLIIQIVHPHLYVTWHAVAVGLVMYYVFLYEISNKYDRMTEMLNRREFDKELERIENYKSIGVVMIDVDDFKKINDTYGHQKGDYYLKCVAKILRENFFNAGNYYRIGGDEFCVICNTDDETYIKECIKNTQNEIKEGQTVDPALPSLSFGYSIYNKSETQNLEESLKQADKYMYKHKKRKKRNKSR